MLDKLCVEFTKSRPRHSNDNGLAETKNGAIVRKHLGYSHIPQRFAKEVNAFCAKPLNPYVNFHLLKPGVTLDALREKARALSDNEAAARLNEARCHFILSIQNRFRRTA